MIHIIEKYDYSIIRNQYRAQGDEMKNQQKYVTIKQLFKGYLLANLSPLEYETKSKLEIMRARFLFLQARASLIAGSNIEAMNLPANIVALAQSLVLSCDKALSALDGDDIALSTESAFDVGKRFQELEKAVVLSKALSLNTQIFTPKSLGGQTTAKIKKDEAQEGAEKCIKIWNELKIAGRPERERGAIIAQRTGITKDTVRSHIKQAGLR